MSNNSSLSARAAATAVVVATAMLTTSAANATTYRFHVSCSHGAKVVEWRTGDVDPGKEYLRVVTGTNNPNCSISDFNKHGDGSLPRETLEGGAAVIAGVPFVGSIVRGLLDF